MASMIFTTEPKGYTAFLTETIEAFSKSNIKGIAIVALTGNENITGYWNMSLQDKVIAENEIRYDVVDGLIMANRDRYFQEEQEE